MALDWANYITLTIDSSKVDSDLTDFPVLIALSSSAGTNSFDATPVFNELVEPIGLSLTNHELNLDKNSEGIYDTHRVRWPCVIKDGSTYKMWYGGQQNGGSIWIIYCTSTDGETWGNFQVVVSPGDEGTYDTSQCYDSQVIKVDSTTYKMWYTGYDGSNTHIIYCDSTDGINWSNHQRVVAPGDEGTYDTQWAGHSAVILDGSIYKMWYSGATGTSKFLYHIYCTSSDGINWSGHTKVINYNTDSEGSWDSDAIYEPSVVKQNGRYRMWWLARDGSNVSRILYSSSTDGTNWDAPVHCIDRNVEGTYDTTRVGGPYPLVDGLNTYIYYHGDDGSYWRILRATSDDYYDNTKNITITDSNDNQLYTEIESWDWANEEAWLWAKIPAVSSSIDTTLYLYYDATVSGNTTYVGDTGDAAAQNVWDNDFIAVWHMSQNPGINNLLESTSNGFDGSFQGSMDSNDLINGIPGKALEFDGNDDRITISDDPTLSFGDGSNDDPITIDAIINIDDNNSDYSIISKYGSSDREYFIRCLNSARLDWEVWDNSRTGYMKREVSGTTETGWHYTCCTYDGSGNVSNLKMYWDLTEITGGTNSSSYTAMENKNADLEIGSLINAGHMKGKIGEIRISRAVRTAAWRKATYYTCWDDLISFEATAPAATAYPNIRINSSWKNMEGAWIFIASSWRTTEVFTFKNGAWKDLAS